MGRFSRKLSVRVGGVAAAVGMSYLLEKRWELRRGSARPIADPKPLRDRAAHWKDLVESDKEHPYDVVVVGGGVIGLYTAVEAAQRGLRTALVEKRDFGSGSASTAEPTTPGAFPFVQRAFRQRDTLWLQWAVRHLKDCTIWRNVAPDCVTNDTRSLLPVLLTGESLEAVVAAVVSTVISPFCGPLQLNVPLPGFLVRSSVPGLQGTRAGIVASEYAVDGMKACLVLAHTAEQLGVTLVNYSPLVSVQSEKTPDSTTTLKLIVRDELQKQTSTEVYTRSVVNCTGWGVDNVKTLFEESKNIKYPTVMDGYFARCLLVVPQTALSTKGTEGFTLPLGAASLQVASTLDSFTGMLVTPWKENCFLIGPSLSPLGGEVSSNYTFHSSSGFKAQKERILNNLKALGVEVEASAVLSCITHVMATLKKPHEVEWTSDIFYNFYHIEIPEMEEDGAAQEGVYHLYGGTRALARRIAEETVQKVILHTPALAGRTFPPSETRWLKLSCPDVLKRSSDSGDPEQRLRDLIRHTYVEHLEDVIFRRTTIGHLSPAQALHALPFVADILTKERGWSARRKTSEIKHCEALLREVAVR